jgi:ketosteroid isomerase-like protein
MTNSKPSVSRRAALGGLTAGLATAAVFRSEPVEAQQSPSADKSVAELKALLAQHDKTFTSHDLEGVLKLYAIGPKTVLIGAGAGELWVGKDEIKTAYQHFFQDFDPGKQDFEYGFATGNVVGNAAWLVATGKLKLTKGSDSREIGMNVSVTFEKTTGAWYITSFHYSNATAIGSGPQT